MTKTVERTCRSLFRSIAFLAITALPVGIAQAADWPTGNVQLVVPAKPGGGTDATARIFAAGLQAVTGGKFVVVNQPGGGGAIAAEQVRTSAEDGTTLLFYHSGILSTYHTGGYDHSPVDEFSVVTAIPVAGSYSLCVPADSPYQTVEDLVAATKAKPDKITLGVQLRGSTHFMAGLIGMSSGSEFRLVEAGSDADKLVQLKGKQINAALINTGGALQYVEAGDLRILATIQGSPDRDPNAPEYPSLAELGYKDAVYGLDFLIFGPKGLSDQTAEAINTAFAGVFADPDSSEKIGKMRFQLMGALPVIDARKRTFDASERTSATAELLGLKN